jgi:hypothetical protein
LPESGSSGADDGDDDGDDDTEDTLTTAEPREAPVAAAPADRPPFSLFAWLKRDGEDKKQT